MSAVAPWLDTRRPSMPSALRAVVDAACEAASSRMSGATLPDRLAEAGLGALGRVAKAVPTRSTAVELLAADALLTYACEAAAEAGPEALERITGRLDYARFATLLEPHSE